MAHTDHSEEDIWEYKPLRKRKKTASASHSKEKSKKKHCSPANSDGSISNGHVPHTSVNHTGSINKGHVLHKSVNHSGSISNGNVPHSSVNNTCGISKGDDSVINHGQSDREAATALNTLCPQSPEPSAEGAAESDFCPICQMPFSILVGKSEIGHVTECLDIPRDGTLGKCMLISI